MARSLTENIRWNGVTKTTICKQGKKEEFCQKCRGSMRAFGSVALQGSMRIIET